METMLRVVINDEIKQLVLPTNLTDRIWNRKRSPFYEGGVEKLVPFNYPALVSRFTEAVIFNIPRDKAMALRLAPHCHHVGFLLGCMTVPAADDRSEPLPNWKEDRDFVIKLHERIRSPLSNDYQMDLYTLYVDDFEVTRVLLEHYPGCLSAILHPRKNDPYFKTIKQQAHERCKLRELPKLCSFLLARHRDFKRAELMKRVDLWLGSRGEVAFVA